MGDIETVETKPVGELKVFSSPGRLTDQKLDETNFQHWRCVVLLARRGIGKEDDLEDKSLTNKALAKVKEEAQQLALIFETVGAFKVKRKGGKGKQIFGSVTAQDVVDIIKAQLQRDVDKRTVSVPEIRETGEYVAELKLHPEVSARIRLNVYAN